MGEDTVSSVDAGSPAGGKPFPFFENETVGVGVKTFSVHRFSSSVVTTILRGLPGQRE
jgi:hypothetical protein